MSIALIGLSGTSWRNRSVDLEVVEQLFYSHPHKVCQKWGHYFSIYERHFSRFRDRPIRFVEIGVSQGGSLDIWAKYFCPDSEIVGLDIDPACKRFESSNIRIFIGDQSDRDFLSNVVSEIGEFDIILDDGGHTMAQQIATFDVMFPALRLGGVYMCEDVHTSYQAPFGGGLRKPGTFIEYMKAKIDELYFWEIPEGNTEVTRFASSISFYNSIVAVEKQRIAPPMYVEVGY